jgi:pSer/pThr/pTyr-binding forkhead associated (FHA) protein
MSAPVRLTVRSGETRGASVEVVGGRIVIGRAEDCDITVPDGKVSRHHAALEQGEDGRISLVDLGSSNGTFLDGHRVESAPIEGPAQIQVGDTVLVSSTGGKPQDATTFGEFRSKTHSAVQRLKVQRSARRATIASGPRWWPRPRWQSCCSPRTMARTRSSAWFAAPSRRRS